MSRTLKIGKTLPNGKPFTLPLDAVAQTFACIGIRGSGKTTTVKRIAEQMCKAGLPWIAFDPVGVWWGLRANKDGSPSDLPVVVFGGKHGDIPIGKGDGKRVARAVVRENICAVIDVFRESKAFWRTFLADMCLELMELEPEEPRHIFIEEAPEFVPQKGRYDLTARTKEAVERLIRLGRNQGYGATLISQRSATVDKDVLSQCENLIVMRSTGRHDRKALQEWVDEKDEDGTNISLEGLAQLQAGEAYFWSPAWLEQFDRVKIHEAETHHPGKTRKVGAAKAKPVTMGNVGDFVERLRGQLEFAEAEEDEAKPKSRGAAKSSPSVERATAKAAVKATEGLKNQINDLTSEVTRLREENRRLKSVADRTSAAEAALSNTRKALQPLYEGLHGLFAETPTNGAPAVDMDVWDPWLAKAGKRGARKMLTILLEKPELTKQQLATLSGVAMKGGTFRGYLSWLRSNGLIRTDGDRVVLQTP